MAQIETWFSQNIMNAVKVHYIDGNVFSQDNDGNKVGVRVFSDGEPVNVGGSISANVIRSDGATVAVEGTASGNEAYVVLPQAAYAVPGLISIIIKETNDEQVTTLCCAVANVYESATSTTVDPGTIIPSIQTLIDDIETAVASIPADYSSLWTTLAPAFSTSTAYTAGQYVTYNGVLYKFTSDHAAGSWAAGDAVSANIGNDITSVKIAFGQNTGAIEEGGWLYKKRIRTDSDPVNFTPASTTTEYYCQVLDCVAGDKFTLTGTAGNTNYRLYCFCQNDGTRVTGGLAPSGSSLKDAVITAPTGATKLVLNSTGEHYIFRGITDTAKHAESVAADADLQSQINSFIKTSEYDFSEEPLRNWAITASDKWTELTTGLSRSYTVKIPENAVKLRITPQEGKTAQVAVLDTYSFPPVQDATPDFSDNYTSRITVSDGDTLEIDVAGDVHYLYVGAVTSEGVDFVPTVEVSAVKSEPGGSSGSQTIINNNTYNITTNPTITTDANGWIQPIDTQTADESGVTDMSGAIMSMLTDTGYCHLAPGIFYVSGNIEMPDNSRLEGCGYGTIIKLMDGVDASTIIMGASCSVANLSVFGALTSGTVPETIGTRFGIEWSGSDKANGIISGCKIFKFSGAGILLKDTGTPVNKGLAISDCYLLYNTVGIFVQKDSEFNKIENCTIYRNHWGILNRGGNNIVCNCGVDKNVIGIQVDDDEGANNGHGSICNCTINHSNDNTGYGIIIEGTGRMLISNCNLYYSKIKLEGTNGNVFTGCGFGQNAGLDVINGECNILNGCMMRDSANFPISITNNNVTQIVNCFYRAGTQVVLS